MGRALKCVPLVRAIVIDATTPESHGPRVLGANTYFRLKGGDVKPSTLALMRIGNEISAARGCHLLNNWRLQEKVAENRMERAYFLCVTLRYLPTNSSKPR
ncbi:hypothetical protein EVAR_34690_1 [Eumeta japonica]|uniref:Uncharacterized protein n=1 Tax=Eumeta variegata TaxID=151549 RepID=A0A4C1XGW7_EUMVA|nr:hypothetical protein EVAR_34690_1 [Eumeta japonica]